MQAEESPATRDRGRRDRNTNHSFDNADKETYAYRHASNIAATVSPTTKPPQT